MAHGSASSIMGAGPRLDYAKLPMLTAASIFVPSQKFFTTSSTLKKSIKSI
jgi:hypothetical protein